MKNRQLIIMLLLLPLFSACAGGHHYGKRHQAVPVASRTSLSLQGLTITTPAAEHWTKTFQDSHTLTLMKPTQKGRYHTITAFVESGFRPEERLTFDQLQSFVARHSDYSGKRFTTISSRNRRVQIQGLDVLRVDFSVEDHGVPFAPGKTFMIVGSDLYFMHPKIGTGLVGSHLMRISFSQRYLKGSQPISLESEMVPFLSGFTITPISVDRLEGGWLSRVDGHGHGIWMKKFPGFQKIIKIERKASGQFFGVAVGRKIPGVPESHWLIDFNGRGEILSQREISEFSGKVKGVLAHPEGGWYVYGDWFPRPYNGRSHELIVARYDAGGKRLWQKSYGGPKVERAVSAVVDQRGHLIVSVKSWSYGVQGGCWLLKLDDHGDKIWEQVHDTVAMDQCRDLTAVDSTLFLMGMSGFAGPGIKNPTRMVMLDHEGKALWHSEPFTISNSLVTMAARNLFLAGTFVPRDLYPGLYTDWATRLVLIDGDGKTRQQKVFRHMYSDGLSPAADGGCLLSGQCFYTGNDVRIAACIVKIGKDGEMEWRQVFPPSTSNGAFSAVSLEDLGFLVSGGIGY